MTLILGLIFWRHRCRRFCHGYQRVGGELVEGVAAVFLAGPAGLRLNEGVEQVSKWAPASGASLNDPVKDPSAFLP